MNSVLRDYSIVGPERRAAFESGLVDAQWYTSPIEREKLRLLMERRNGPAIRDTLLWFALLGGSGYLAHRSWGSWWMLPAFFVYGTLYGSVSDSRWHECGHRTAFKTAWMNDAVYFLASFMVWREAVSWRWSHIRHHSDTIIVGRDPEIAFQRPMKARAPLKEFLGLTSNPGETKKILLNVIGRFTPDELDYLPESEHGSVIRTARVYVAVWLGVFGLCLVLRTLEPLMFVVLPSFYGKWLLVWTRRKHCRSSPQQSVNPYESSPSVPLLEYEFSYGTPYVPECSVSRPSGLKRSDESGLSTTVSGLSVGVSRNLVGVSAPKDRAELFR